MIKINVSYHRESFVNDSNWFNTDTQCSHITAKLSHTTYPYTTCLVRNSEYFHLQHMSLFAKVIFLFVCLKTTRLNAWSGMAETSLIQCMRASPGFSLETCELRHWDGNKTLFSSATEEITVCCSYLDWTGFTLVWLYYLNSNDMWARNTETKPHSFYLSGWRNRISEMQKF